MLFIKKTKMTKKKVIRLTESQLKDIVAASAARVLEEGAADRIVGLGKSIGRGLFNLSGAGESVGEWEKRHPDATKFFSTVFGLTPEADKARRRINGIQEKMKSYVTKNFGRDIVDAYVRFADTVTKMVGSNSVQDSDVFASLDDDTKYGISPSFYNNCISIVNMGYKFLEKWLTRMPDGLNEVKRIENNSSFVTPQEKREVATTYSYTWNQILNGSFRLFTLVCNECYEGLKNEFGNIGGVDRQKLVSAVSEFINEIKDMRNSMYRIDTYWFNKSGSNSGNRQQGTR